MPPKAAAGSKKKPVAAAATETLTDDGPPSAKKVKTESESFDEFVERIEGQRKKVFEKFKESCRQWTKVEF
jgi:predicted CopG family antitoxin